MSRSSGSSDRPGGDTEPEVTDREVAEVRVVEGTERHAQTVTIGPHTVRADEPPQLGGRDAAPMPLELLLAALGSCSSVTVRMYADRKGWPLEGVSLTCRLERRKRGDPEAGPTGHRIERTLTLTGDLDAGQRQRLLQIADRCPVHRMLGGGVPIATVLAEPV
jgi:putative redox protein